MSKSTATETSKCEKCGKCCIHMGSPLFLPIGKKNGGGGDANGYLTDFYHLPNMPTNLIEEIQDYRRSLSSGKGIDRGGERLPCFWFDLATKRCKHYRWRPNVCREHYCGDGLEEFLSSTTPAEPDKIVEDLGCCSPRFQKTILKSVLKMMTRRDQKQILTWLSRWLEQSQKDGK